MEKIPAKSILSSRGEGNAWFGCDYGMNLCKGCCYGCIYCDGRNLCYRIAEFDRVRAKENALALLSRELLTRRFLELLDHALFGASANTKSSLIPSDKPLDTRRLSPSLVVH